MSEIDLVPIHYRRVLWLRRWLRMIGIASLSAAILLGATKGSLAYSIKKSRDQVESLEEDNDLALQQQARLGALREQTLQMRNQLAILSQLRQGIFARSMFDIVDRCLDGTVGFTSWKFRRAQELVKKDSEAVSTGYFLIIPAQGAEDDEQRAWRLRAHMEIQGRAIDHSALAGFVRRLVEQPEIDEVRVLDTQIVEGKGPGSVQFELAAVVRTSGG